MTFKCLVCGWIAVTTVRDHVLLAAAVIGEHMERDHGDFSAGAKAMREGYEVVGELGRN